MPELSVEELHLTCCVQVPSAWTFPESNVADCVCVCNIPDSVCESNIPVSVYVCV